jgi:hypothetical protein
VIAIVTVTVVIGVNVVETGNVSVNGSVIEIMKDLVIVIMDVNVIVTGIGNIEVKEVAIVIVIDVIVMRGIMIVIEIEKEIGNEQAGLTLVNVSVKGMQHKLSVLNMML